MVGVGRRANSRVCLPWAIRSWLDRVPDLDAVERHDDGHYRGGVVHVRDVARHPARGAARHNGLRPELAAAAPIAHAAELADGWLHLRGIGGSEEARCELAPYASVRTARQRWYTARTGRSELEKSRGERWRVSRVVCGEWRMRKRACPEARSTFS